MVWRSIIHTIVWVIGLGAILFATAGNVRWLPGWAFLAETAILSLVMCVWLARHDPALLESRLSIRFHSDQSIADRIFMACAGLGFFAWLILAALDGGRFHLSSVPAWGHWVGAALIALCMLGAGWVFQANSFAAPQVRIQAERNQAVATTGPYRYLRHPMYAAAILYFIGLPLLLGSLWALVPVPVFVLGFAWRIIAEERLLRQQLPGYTAYADKVRYRFVPGVW